MAGIPTESPLVLRESLGSSHNRLTSAEDYEEALLSGYPPVGLVDAKNVYHAEQKGHRLPRPERRGLRSPWGQACSSANRSTDPHYWRAWPLAPSETLRSILVNAWAWFVLRKTWRYYRATRYAFPTASAILFSLARTFGARPHSGGSPVTKQFRLRASSGLRAS